MNKFEEIIHELGIQLNLPLHAERGFICRLNINNIFHIQLEHEENRNRILLATYITEIPPGRFREDILKEALKINNLFPLDGIFSFSERANKLALFIYLPFISLTAQQLYQHLDQFIEKADKWRVAIETGQIASISTSTSRSLPPPFAPRP